MTDTVVQAWTSAFRNAHIGRQLLRRVRAEGLENTWADGVVLLADGLSAADTVYDFYATVSRIKSENEEQSRALDAWVSEQAKRDAHEGVIAWVAIFLGGGRKLPLP